jgi:uncharacterized protein (DUF1330 family)
MSAYIIVEIEITDPVGYEEYKTFQTKRGPRKSKPRF